MCANAPEWLGEGCASWLDDVVDSERGGEGTELSKVRPLVVLPSLLGFCMQHAVADDDSVVQCFSLIV